LATEKYSPPNYCQTRRKIIGSIQQGDLLPRASVTSENEIIERYGVSKAEESSAYTTPKAAEATASPLEKRETLKY